MVALITQLLSQQAGLTLHHDLEGVEKIYLTVDLEDVLHMDDAKLPQKELECKCDDILRNHSSSPRFARSSITQLVMFAVSSDELRSEPVWLFYRRYLCERSYSTVPPAVIAFDRQKKRWLQH